MQDSQQNLDQQLRETQLACKHSQQRQQEEIAKVAMNNQVCTSKVDEMQTKVETVTQKVEKVEQKQLEFFGDEEKQREEEEERKKKEEEDKKNGVVSEERDQASPTPPSSNANMATNVMMKKLLETISMTNPEYEQKIAEQESKISKLEEKLAKFNQYPILQFDEQKIKDLII